MDTANNELQTILNLSNIQMRTLEIAEALSSVPRTDDRLAGNSLENEWEIQQQAFNAAVRTAADSVAHFPSRLRNPKLPFDQMDIRLCTLYDFLTQARLCVIFHDCYLQPWQDVVGVWGDPLTIGACFRKARTILVKAYTPHSTRNRYNNHYWDFLAVIYHEMGHTVFPFNEEFAEVYEQYGLFTHYCNTVYCPLTHQTYAHLLESPLQYNLALRTFSQHLYQLNNENEYLHWSGELLPQVLIHETFEQLLFTMQDYYSFIKNSCSEVTSSVATT